MNERLAGILSPVAVDSFLRHYQAREYFHVARNSPGHYDGLVCVDDLDEALQGERLPAAFLNVVKGGKRYPVEDWSRTETSSGRIHLSAVPERLFELYAEGATLVLNQVDATFPALNTLCRDLCSELGFPVHANAYITPPGAAGFDKHADDHEVIALQIAGCKRWTLYPAGGPQAEVYLQPGDLLYLPRGLHHSARTEDGESIHLTLGLRPVYAFGLIAALASLALESPAFQQPLPPKFAGDDARICFEETVARALHDLILQTQPADLVERFQKSMVSRPPKLTGRLSDLGRLGDITLGTRVCMRAGISLVVQAKGKALNVTSGDKSIQVAEFLKGPVDLILSGETFAVGELSGLISDPGKIKLICEFVKAGWLRILR